MPRRRARRAHLAPIVPLLCAVMAIGPTATVAVRAALPCEARARTGASGSKWKATRPPRWPQRERPIATGSDEDVTASAVDEHRPSTIFVTNGADLLRSTDGGCRWKTVYALPAPDEPLRRITSIGTSGSDVYAAIAYRRDADVRTDAVSTSTDAVTALPIEVVHSNDGGNTWTTSDIDVVGGWPAVRIAPSKPEVIYLAVQVGVQARTTTPARAEGHKTLVYRSSDSGLSWTLQSGTAPEVGTGRPGGRPGTSFGLLVDPLDPGSLWMWDETVVQRSVDGGKSWANVDALDAGAFGKGATAIDVWHRAGRPARVVVAPALFCVPVLGGFQCPDPFIFWSDDGGVTWRKIRAPWYLASATHGRSSDALVVLTRAGSPGDDRYPSNVFAYDAGGRRWIDITPPDYLPGLKELVAVRGGRAIAARTKAGLQSYAGPFL